MPGIKAFLYGQPCLCTITIHDAPTYVKCITYLTMKNNACFRQKRYNVMTYLQGLGLSRILSNESERLTIQKYPDLKLLSWSTINHVPQRESLLNNASIRVLFAWVGSQSGQFFLFWRFQWIVLLHIFTRSIQTNESERESEHFLWCLTILFFGLFACSSILSISHPLSLGVNTP